MSLEMSVEEQC